MINIVHVDIHFDDQRKMTAIEIKVKSVSKEDMLSGHPLVSTTSAAFYETTLLADVGEHLETAINPNRNNVVNLKVVLKDDNDLTYEDVGNFLNSFQSALDQTSLF